jgi:N6-L-threonylcarbamoyladenine synthase
MTILGIETSCDETAASIIEGGGDSVRVLSNVISSQIKIHSKFGGVIPEVAAREHIKNILPVIDEALKKSKIENPRLPPACQSGRDGQKKSKILLDAIAVTVGPGLITSLIVGIETAKTLAFSWNLPIVPVNHIEGHIYANWIGKKTKILFPAIILTVSGGHTSLVLLKSHGNLKAVGETRDDAAGEAFDKAASLLGLGYPGGPAIAERASIFMEKSPLQANKIVLPRPMLDSSSLDFSFSGLKTALKYGLEKDKGWKEKTPEYAHEFQQAVLDVLVAKTVKAAKANKVKTVMLSGGVASNVELREQLSAAIIQCLPGAEFHMPDIEYCTDNAAMIAAAGYFKARRKAYAPLNKIKVDPTLVL